LEKIAKIEGRPRRQTGREFLYAIPCKLFSYLVAHTFAIKLIYPGSLSIINWALGKIFITIIILIYIFLHSYIT